jgi:anti-sigma regulatory factor (Ser/Thr protein kinase)
MPTVSVSFTALPVHVRTARLVALATARRAGVDEELLDEVRFAVGEACSRAVGINADRGEPVVMTLVDEQDRFSIEVRDAGTTGDVPGDLLSDLDHSDLGAPEQREAVEDGDASLPDPLPSGFGLAVISGLVEHVDVTHGLDGTRVSLTWPLPPRDLTA